MLEPNSSWNKLIDDCDELDDREWISVKDKLPESKQDTNGWWSIYHCRVWWTKIELACSPAQFSNGRFTLNYSDGTYQDITEDVSHWQPVTSKSPRK